MSIRPFFIFFLLAAQTAVAQTFFPTPAPLLEQELAPEQANECYIFFNNPSGDSLRLRWKKVEAAFPAGWTVDLCDYGTCYVGVPAAGLMNAVAGPTQPYLKLIVQPGTTPGAAWFWFRVYADGQPDHYADVFFSLHTPGVTGVDTRSETGLYAFPNPVFDILNLDNDSDHPVFARLVHVTGAMPWAGTVPAGEQLPLDTSAWPAGLYVLQTSAQTQVIVRLN